MTLLWSLLLLLVANGAPVLASKLLADRAAWPIDAGLVLADGRPLLGASKTWRGLLAAMLATALAGGLLGVGWGLGAWFGLLAMLGDLAASFTKRRLGIPPSGRARFLDQLPEALLPLAVLREPLGLDWADVLIAASAFTLFEWLVSPWLYRLHIRQRPY